MSAIRRLRAIGIKLMQWWAPVLPAGQKVPEKVRHVRTGLALALVIVIPFGLYNLQIEKLLWLGVAELTTAVCFVARSHPGASLVFGALLVFGTIESTTVYWIFILPFIIFFMKDHRNGWLAKLAFIACAGVYLIFVAPLVTFDVPHTPMMISRFLMAFFLYTVVAAVFNRHRLRYEGVLMEGRKQAEAAALAKTRFLSAASQTCVSPPMPWACLLVG